MHGETDPETLHQHSHSQVSAYFRRFHILPWSAMVDMEYFRWAGKMVRQAEANPGRLTGRILKYKQGTTIFDFAQQNRGYQGHATRFKPWRWETEIFNFFHQCHRNWQEEAMDIRSWRELEEMYIDWRKNIFSARSIHVKKALRRRPPPKWVTFGRTSS